MEPIYQGDSLYSLLNGSTLTIQPNKVAHFTIPVANILNDLLNSVVYSFSTSFNKNPDDVLQDILEVFQNNGRYIEVKLSVKYIDPHEAKIQDRSETKILKVD